MKTMYKTSYLSIITPVEITRETPAKVYFIGYSGKETSEKKQTTYKEYHETYEDAKTFLIERCERKIKTLEESLSSEKNNLEFIHKL